MEEDKKKKRNKKKKNKQTKAAEDAAAVGDGETAPSVSNGQQQDYYDQVSETAAVENDAARNTDADLDKHHQPNGTEGYILAEAGKQQWLQQKAELEETISQLEIENDAHLQKEAGLEIKIVHLLSEKDSWLQKEAGLEEKIRQLLDENATLGLRGACLEEKIKRLEREKDSSILKEASLEEKIKHIEREKDSWILKENSTKETIASLNGDITRLQSQVVGLEESRNNLLQENQQLMGNISTLQSQIQNIEKAISSARSSDERHASENKDLNSQLEAALVLVEKLITENVELVEKVNELSVELNRLSTTAGLSSPFASNGMVGTAETASVANPLSEYSENRSAAGQKLNSLEDFPVKDGINGGDNVDTTSIPNSSEAGDSGEIVQIPLDENEVWDLESQATKTYEKATVPFSDAPLIGAPFRLLSSVAKYVSGADLINKS